MDVRDRDMSIVQQLKDINQGAGVFVAGVLADDLTKEEQIAFATRLVDLSIAIKERATSTAGLVVEGSVLDDRDSPPREPPSGD